MEKSANEGGHRGLKRKKAGGNDVSKENEVNGPRVTINQYMKCRKRRLSPRLLEKKNITSSVKRKSLFETLPLEVLFCTFSYIPLQSLGALTLASKDFRDLILTYVYSKKGKARVVPHVGNIPDDADLDSFEYKISSQKCHEHYKQLGVMLKRSTFLFTTKVRLSHVVKVLGQLRDSHKKICLELGGDLAFSCYGIFFHAFISGWEDYEKSRAFAVIKEVSLLSERIEQVMNTKPGNIPKYERYVRVLCREIFLNKSCDADKGFWLAQILKFFPICIQAKLLYILYGPTDEENDYIEWDRCIASADTIIQDLSVLSKGFHYMLNDVRGNFTADTLISIFDEITTITSDWDIENIAILLKFCGDTICCEVLGNKAINNRISELSYLLYYIWQYCSRSSHSNVRLKKEHEWFISLLQYIGKLCPRGKNGLDITKQIFSIWEECVMERVEDQTNNNDSQQSLETDEMQWFRESLRSITSLASILLAKQMQNGKDALSAD